MPASLSDLPIHVLIAIPAIVLLGYTIFGATGFGSTIIAVPLLAHALPLIVSVPLMTSLDLFAATSTALRNRAQVAWPEFRAVAPAVVVGIALGATLLVHLPAGAALTALGVFVTAYGAYVLSGARRLRRAPQWLGWPIGVVGGVFSALFGTGGPVYVVFLSARIHDKGALRATTSLMVTLAVWLRIVLFALAGVLLHAPLLLLVATALPAMALGLYFGHRLHQRLSSAGVLRLIAVLLVINGLTLLARVLS
jgi:uncharacterized membrane protein YfcA